MITTTARTTKAPPKIPAVALVLLPCRWRLRGAGLPEGLAALRFGGRFTPLFGWPTRSRARSFAESWSVSSSAPFAEVDAGVTDLGAGAGAPDRRVVEERFPVPGGLRVPLPDLREFPLFAILLRFPSWVYE
jgi:hypothetical protein